MRPASLLPKVSLHRPGFDVLTVLCGTLLLVQVGVVALGGFDPGNGRVRGLFEVFWLSREGIGEWKLWTMVTYAFLHGNWLHFIPNLLVIYMIGGRVLHILGTRGFMTVYGGGVLLGGVLHLLFFPSDPMGTGVAGKVPLVGASGGAIALLIALTSLSPDSKMWPLPVSGKNLGRGLLLASLLLSLMAPGLGIPGLSGVGRWLVSLGGAEGKELSLIFTVSHICHVGGGMVGVLYSRWLLRRPITLAELQRKRAKKEGLAA